MEAEMQALKQKEIDDFNSKVVVDRSKTVPDTVAGAVVANCTYINNFSCHSRSYVFGCL